MKNIITTLCIAVAVAAAIAVFWLAAPAAVDDQPEEERNVRSSPDAGRQGSIESDTGAPMPEPHIAAAPERPQQEASSPQAHEEIKERLDAMQQRRPNRSFDPAAVAAAVKRKTVWAPAEEVPKHLPLKKEEFEDGRQFIQLDSLKIETLMPGDSVKITIDETGYEYMVTVDNIEKHDYDSISWYGHIDGSDGQTYEASFTRGESLTVGGLDTPEGHYVLQAHGNDGWIASSGLLFKRNPDVPDVVYPEDVQHRQEENSP